MITTTSRNPGVIKFAADLQKAADRQHVAIGKFCQKLTYDLYQLIVMDTPVDTGRARASWNVALDEPDESVPAGIPDEERKKREAAKRAGGHVGIDSRFEQFATNPPTPDVIKDIDGKRKIFITSSLVYINELENGHSDQRPHGMVRVNLAAMEAAVEAAGMAARE